MFFTLDISASSRCFQRGSSSPHREHYSSGLILKVDSVMLGAWGD
jgi:hypothetical protein